MLLRRCANLLFQSREEVRFELARLLQGETGLVTSLHWYALAAHLPEPVALDGADCIVLGEIGETEWQARAALAERFGDACIERLHAAGLLVEAAADGGAAAQADATARDQFWHPLAAVFHAFSRWRGVDAEAAGRASGMRTVRDMVDKLGTPPTHAHARAAAEDRIALPAPARSGVDELLDARVTCRNFDAGRPLPLALLSILLSRVFGVRGQVAPAPGVVVLKKTSPSGGGLHATEAYLLVRAVDGLAAGLYHYHVVDHALEPIAAETAVHDGLALRGVAGQGWFADAAVQIVLVPRFGRSFWKYRNHAKAYRALLLDAGHLSQTLYITATELGLGAFITAAINEVELEAAFGLDPRQEGPVAVCGVGWRGPARETVEFDPRHAVWPVGDALRDQPAGTVPADDAAGH